MEKNFFKSNIFQIVIIILLIANLIINFVPSSNSIQTIGNAFVEQKLAEEKSLLDYSKDIGKQYITVSGDKISKGSYSTYIIGTVENNSNETIYNVNVRLSFYSGNKVVDYGYESYDEISAKSTMPMELYAPSEFDTYTIDYTSGIIY